MPLALDVLRSAESWDPGTAELIVLAGDEPFLVAEMLRWLRRRFAGGTPADGEPPDDCAWREFDGTSLADPRDVFDEAATLPLFGGAGVTRAAVVRTADAFVSQCRDRLEELAGRDRGGRGVVILEVRSLPANTRLAKATSARGTLVDVSVPARYDLARWLGAWARERHGRALANGTADRLLERLAGDLGRIDQALARLAATGGSGPIPPDAVDDAAGTPRDRTAWSMIEAAAAGDAPAALARLAELLDAGESPIALAAQASTVLRRLSSAARLLGLPPGAGRPAGIDEALRQAGVAAWPKALAQARGALEHLGARRARGLPGWLHHLDRGLKGTSARGPRAALALEELFCRLAGPAPGAAARPARGAADAVGRNGGRTGGR